MVRVEIRSLRPSRRDGRRLVVALLISLLLHLGAWGGYELGKKFGWWQRLHATSWLKKPEPKNSAQLAANKEVEPPMVFVDVSHAEPEPPKQTKYYSNKNSRAANAEAAKEAAQPKFDGSQKMIPKTEDVPTLSKLQPAAPPPAEPTPETKPLEDTKPHDRTSLGDLKLRMPEPNLAESKPAPPPPRPRTLKQAQAQASPQLPGQKLQQDGGVKRQLQWSSLDVKSTAFGEYDRAIVEAVTQRWYDLLDSRRFAQDRTGKVTVHFKLLPDGSIIEVSFFENTVGQLLGYVCQEAIQEAAPFKAWPSDMRRMINANFREITFSFYYY